MRQHAFIYRSLMLSAAILTSLALTAGTALAGRAAAIKDLRYSTTNNYTRVVLELSEKTNFSVNRLRNPDRLYIDVNAGSVRSGIKRSMNVGDGLLGGIRFSRFDSKTVRVVMDIEPGNTYKVFRLDGPPRVVVDFIRKYSSKDGMNENHRGDSETMELARRKLRELERRKAELKARMTARDAKKSGTSSPTAAGSSVSVVPLSAPLVASGPAMASVGKPLKPPRIKVRETRAADEARKLADARAKAIARSSGTKEPEKGKAVKVTRKPASKAASFRKQQKRSGKFSLHRVVIDAGHGGKDPGALGRGGLKEKVLALDIAKRVKRKLEAMGGYEVILTRDRDRFLELEDRSKIANKKDADIFVSIHANASRNKRARGLETYYLNKNSDEDTIKIAARENAVPIEEMKKAIDTTNKDYILASLATQRKQYQSADLAKKVRESMYSAISSRYHGVTTKDSSMGPFYVLYGARMPAVLIEVSYITNRTEASRLRTTTYRDYLARGIAEGIKEYLSSIPASADLAKR